jgi:predicted DNA-binding ribbon-helix-helix protein
VAEPLDVLEKARRDVGLTVADLWYRYFTLGGMSTALEVEGVLYGALRATAHERDLLAVALNERFAELGGDHPVPYSGDEHDENPS